MAEKQLESSALSAFFGSIATMLSAGIQTDEAVEYVCRTILRVVIVTRIVEPNRIRTSGEVTGVILEIVCIGLRFLQLLFQDTPTHEVILTDILTTELKGTLVDDILDGNRHTCQSRTRTYLI